MRDFDNPHVMTLKGVCLDGGPVPYVVLPYMANGSLLSYLRKQRLNLVIKKDADEENQEIVRFKRLSKIFATIQLFITRYFSQGNDSWTCVYRWLKAWSIWPVRR